ncbi:MAG: C_GCAxxG_C_C family protein [Smithella sp.]|nr:C_GCAxxG_C_C family protein [Smithella sp.]MDM7987737.1 C-GCAxxG-C-C family protein [Smithella sp.]HOU51346.1 C-GCAxxG-C-C family protein [Smithella sp.]HQG66934.1 C-GCAxxG-C-C family protein [Smithella sp.]HQI73327.1 C-GCAxxG-C-C family protein [Smithella sp.]
MMTKEVKATAFFKQGYNCAQAVLLAFADDLKMDKNTVIKLTSSFGGGMGRLREVCGAVSGIFMVAGMFWGYTDPDNNRAKAEHYRRIQKLASQFKEIHGSIICRDLLGLTEKPDNPIPESRTVNYYKKRPCVQLVGDATRILEEMIRQEEIKGSE